MEKSTSTSEINVLDIVDCMYESTENLFTIYRTHGKIIQIIGPMTFEKGGILQNV